MTTTPPTNASARDAFFYDNEDVGLDALAELQCEADAEIKYRKEKVAFTKAEALKVKNLVKELEALVQTKKLLRKHMNLLVAKCTETKEPETSRIQRKIKQMELHWALKHKRCRSIKDTLNYPPTPAKIPHPKFPRPGSNKRKRDDNPPKPKKKLTWHVRVVSN